MSEWGTRIDIPIFNNQINIKNLQDIQQYEYNCKDKKCLKYMYNNGKTIYDYMSLDELLKLGKFECVKDEGHTCYH